MLVQCAEIELSFEEEIYDFLRITPQISRNIYSLFLIKLFKINTDKLQLRQLIYNCNQGARNYAVYGAFLVFQEARSLY